MTVAGIIAEYNPFHFGHRYLIQKARQEGADAILCIMSGNFVQRADVAVCDKFSRAAMAVLEGADLVLELPVRYAIASAAEFARGGIKLLRATGIANCLCFGSESGSQALYEMLQGLKKAEASGLIRTQMKTGRSYPTARQQAMEQTGTVCFPEKPNDILGLEYLLALEKLAPNIRPMIFKRIGDYHSEQTQQGILSATGIRKLLYAEESAEPFVPKNTGRILAEQKTQGRCPADLRQLERTILTFYRTTPPEQYANCIGYTEGLEHRVADASTAVSLDEFYRRIKTKRYTHSAVRRAVLCGLLGLQKTEREPAYLRTLALNDTGRMLLREIKKKGSLPVIPALTPQLLRNQTMSPWVREELIAGEYFAFCLPYPAKRGRELTESTRYFPGKTEPFHHNFENFILF